MKSDFHKDIVSSMPYAYAYHELILDESGRANDYIFLEINAAYEQLIGFDKSRLIQAKASEIIPDMLQADSNWLSELAHTAMTGEQKTFQQFIEPLNQWFDVDLFSDQKGYFSTIFRALSAEQVERATLQSIAQLAELMLVDQDQAQVQEKTASVVKRVSGAKYAALNIYNETGTGFKTVALTGDNKNIRKAAKIIGFSPLGHKWPYDPVREKSLKGKDIASFENLTALTAHRILPAALKQLERMFQVGKVYIANIAINDKTLGDFTIIMPKGADLQNTGYIKFLSDLTGQYLLQQQTRRQLQATTAELAQFFDVNLDLLCIADMEGRFLRVNKAWSEILGYNQDEIEGRRFLDFVHPDDVEPTMAAISRLSQNEQVINFVNRYRIQDGTYRYIEWRSHPGCQVIYAAARDVTERLRMEQELKSSEQKFRLYTENAPVGVFVSDRTGQITMVNQMTCDLTDYSQDELMGLSVQDLLAPEFRQKGLALFSDIKEGELITGDFLVQKKQGSQFWVNLFAMHFNEHEIIGYAQDVTEKKQANERLLREHEQLMSIFDHMAAPVYVVDMDSYEILYINDAGKQDLSEIQGEKCWQALHPGEKGLCSFCPIPALKNHDAPVSLDQHREYYSRLSKKWYQCSDASIRWPDGRLVKLTVSFDISQRKEAEKQDKFISTAMANIFDSVIVTDRDCRISYVNKSSEALYDYTAAEMMDQPISRLYPDAYLHQLKDEILPVIETGLTFTGEQVNCRKDGSLFFCEVTVSSLVSENDQPYAYVFTQKDVSEKKKMLDDLRDSHNRYDELARQSRTITWSVDTKGVYRKISPLVQEIWGYRPDELVGKKRFYDLFTGDYAPAVKKRFQEIMAKKEPFVDFINTTQAKDGEKIIVSTNGLPILTEDGDLVGYNGSDTDITERIRLEEEKYLEQEKFRTTLLSVGDGIIATDDKGKITVMNRVAEYLTGWTQEEASGKSLMDVFNIVNAYTQEPCENPAEQVLMSGQVMELANHTMLISKNGRQIPVEDSAAPIINIQGKVFGVVIVFRDYTEKREKQREVEYLSFHDHLTGFYNRRYLDDALDRLDTTRNLPFSVIVIDVNGLKLTNDAFGHNMGDKLLQTVSKILNQTCRREDIIARTGGDEFTILLPQTEAEQAEAIKYRIQSIAQKTKLDSIVISLAVGYAVKTDQDQNIREVMREADHHMYQNKIKYGKDMRNQTIEIILQSIRHKNEAEQLHAEKVSLYCEGIARAMSMSEEEIKDLKTLGILHDIGKIAVSSELLAKQESLAEDERIKIKQHTVTGYNILKGVEDYAALAEDVLYHHEWWDGTGYPSGLRSEEIPLNSRIIAVASAYESMTGTKNLKQSMTSEAAVSELRKAAGSQFDPQIVQIFIEQVIHHSD